jgi:hypothetical protein
MNLHTLNFWAVLAAAVSAFLVGGLWYSPVLFAGAGFLAGFGWGAMGIAIVSLFERRPAAYALINGGYLTSGADADGADSWGVAIRLRQETREHPYRA